ncbi:hypothetical protein HKBW3S03_01676, partial [Candidatus Hakubella thermalkaliphila]
EVCQSILLQQGRVLGGIGGWLIKRMRLEDEDVEVVLVGGVYGGENPLLMDQLTLSLHQLAPSAKVVFHLFEPAIGGYLLVLEDKGVYIQASGIRWNLRGETGTSQRWSGGRRCQFVRLEPGSKSQLLLYQYDLHIGQG